MGSLGDWGGPPAPPPHWEDPTIYVWKSGWWHCALCWKYADDKHVLTRRHKSKALWRKQNGQLLEQHPPPPVQQPPPQSQEPPSCERFDIKVPDEEAAEDDLSLIHI